MITIDTGAIVMTVFSIGIWRRPLKKGAIARRTAASAC